MQTFQAWMNSLNGIVWGPAMLVLILGTGLYLQIRLGGMPIRASAAGCGSSGAVASATSTATAR